MTTVPLSEAKARRSEIADEVGRTHERVHITRSFRHWPVCEQLRESGSASVVVAGVNDDDLVIAEPTDESVLVGDPAGPDDGTSLTVI